ncbi:hypothetical protein BDW75DRAFT_223402 [Aspergillus navahoensis]
MMGAILGIVAANSRLTLLMLTSSFESIMRSHLPYLFIPLSWTCQDAVDTFVDGELGGIKWFVLGRTESASDCAYTPTCTRISVD